MLIFVLQNVTMSGNVRTVFWHHFCLPQSGPDPYVPLSFSFPLCSTFPMFPALDYLSFIGTPVLIHCRTPSFGSHLYHTILYFKHHFPFRQPPHPSSLSLLHYLTLFSLATTLLCRPRPSFLIDTSLSGTMIITTMWLQFPIVRATHPVAPNACGRTNQPPPYKNCY